MTILDDFPLPNFENLQKYPFMMFILPFCLNSFLLPTETHKPDNMSLLRPQDPLHSEAPAL